MVVIKARKILKILQVLLVQRNDDDGGGGRAKDGAGSDNEDDDVDCYGYDEYYDGDGCGGDDGDDYDWVAVDDHCLHNERQTNVSAAVNTATAPLQVTRCGNVLLWHDSIFCWVWLEASLRLNDAATTSWLRWLQLIASMAAQISVVAGSMFIGVCPGFRPGLGWNSQRCYDGFRQPLCIPRAKGRRPR